MAVAYPTKILFWKRITAGSYTISVHRTLLLILQRYYFESESQHLCLYPAQLLGCCLSYKDTILKANHSSTAALAVFDAAVAYPTKILFWKRITATARVTNAAAMLLLILQRYYFESESQHCHALYQFGCCCCLSYKDTILKANHSYKFYITVPVEAVAYPTKILFWKRITAAVVVSYDFIALLLILQRYYFESESQLIGLIKAGTLSCCLSYKDTILKANHSRNGTTEPIRGLLLILQRYYFESESQPDVTVGIVNRCCCLSYKDTILKANHS